MRTILLAAALLVLAGCAVSPATVQQIGPDEYDALAARDDVTVIDVHIPEQEHLPGTDAVIAYNDIDAIKQAAPDKNAPVVLYCRSGSMSASAAQQLIQDGYTQVYDLSGGRNAYVARG